MSARLSGTAQQTEISEATISRMVSDQPGVSLVGLVLPELDNPIYPAFAHMIEASLFQQGFTPVLCAFPPTGPRWDGREPSGGVSEDEYIEMLLDRQAMGIIFMSGQHGDSTSDPERYRKLIARSLPIVLINGFTEGIEAPFISCDERKAAEVAVSHLVELGHRKIGLITGPDRFFQVGRKVDGYRAAVSRFGLPELISLSQFGVEGGRDAATPLLDQGVTGFVCGSDLMALGAIRAARARGLTVPGDVSVVGADDSPLMAFTDPPLTTLRQPVRAMAETAVRAVVGEIKGHPVPRSERLFRPELVVRDSTAAAPA
jgi:LacI family repressor for deo operon, udp, cdd, tsx, nupC, and nupG